MTMILTFLRRSYVRLALLSAAAAAVAYAIAGVIPWIDAAVAGLTALISVRPTFHDTAAESVRQVFGTLLGALCGLGLVSTVGYSPAAMFTLVVACFIVARYLKLGEEGAGVMGVTVILVMGPLTQLAGVEHRFAGVVLGALLALTTSLWVRPGKPHTRALSEAVHHADTTAQLLTEISDHLATHRGKVPKKTAKAWLARSETTMVDLGLVRIDADAAARSSRWSPLVNKEEAQAVLDQVRIAQVTARTVYNMCHDLAIASRKHRAMTGSLAQNMAGALAATADAISQQNETALENPAGMLAEGNSPVRDWEDSRGDVIDEMRRVDETQSILLAGSMLRDMEKITDALTEDDPATTGPLPVIPDATA
jgi:uncharacterized membrane protein YgaE (UPF0421/DUF939 family)